MSEIPSEITDAVRPGHAMEKADNNGEGMTTYTCSACGRAAYYDFLWDKVSGPATIEECFS